MTWLLLLPLLLSDGPSSLSDIEATLEAVKGKMSKEEDAALLAKLIETGTPIVDGNEVLFVIRSPRAGWVRLVGDLNEWGRKKIVMKQAGKSPYFYVKRHIDVKSRIEYRFDVSGNRQADTWNPRVSKKNSLTANSILVMAEHAPQELAEFPDGGTRGKVIRTSDAGRRISIYTPPAYEAHPDRRYPVQYFQSGQAYLAEGKAADIIDRLITSERIPPIIAVFIRAGDENTEFHEDKKYTRYFVKELVPWMDENYRTIAEPKGRGLAGRGLGGLISFHLAYKHPKVFGRVGSQSGIFLSKPRIREDGSKTKKARILAKVKKAKEHPERVFMAVGTYEESLRDEHITFRETYGKAGPEVRFGMLELPQGGGWYFWCDTLPALLTTLWSVAEDAQDK